jgi:lysozyme
MPEDREKLTRQLMRHEGTGPVKHGRFLPYEDTVNVMTIGYGRNLSARGLSAAEVVILLENDIDECIRDCDQTWPWFATLDPIRQRVLVDMRFNLGHTGLLKFTKTLAAIEAGEYELAAARLLQSLWARQVGQRAIRLSKMMATGAEA